MQLGSIFRSSLMSPSDVNKLIADYLQESGYDKSLFEFTHEAQVTNYKSQHNLLRKLVQKGLYHSILQQKLLPAVIPLQNDFQPKQHPQKVVASATYNVVLQGVEQLESLKINNMYYIFVRQQDQLRIFVAYNDQLKFVFKTSSELFIIDDMQLVTLNKFQIQVFTFPGCELVDQKPIKRKGIAKFIAKSDNDFIVNEFDKTQIDGFIQHNGTKYYWVENKLFIKGNIFHATINFLDIIESNCIINIKIYQDIMLCALDTGVLFGQLQHKNPSIISAVPQTLPNEDIFITKWFLPISMLQYKNMLIFNDQIVIYTQDQLYIVSDEGKIIDYYEIEEIFKVVVVNSQLCVVSSRQILVLGNQSYIVKVEFSIVHGVTASQGKLIIAHDNKIEIVSV